MASPSESVNPVNLLARADGVAGIQASSGPEAARPEAWGLRLRLSAITPQAALRPWARRAAREKGGQPAQVATRVPGAGPGRATWSVGWVVGTAPQHWFGGKPYQSDVAPTRRRATCSNQQSTPDQAGQITRSQTPEPALWRLDGAGSTMVTQAGRQYSACPERNVGATPHVKGIYGPTAP
jgi:hypothetical protein